MIRTFPDVSMEIQDINSVPASAASPCDTFTTPVLLLLQPGRAMPRVSAMPVRPVVRRKFRREIVVGDLAMDVILLFGQTCGGLNGFAYAWVGAAAADMA